MINELLMLWLLAFSLAPAAAQAQGYGGFGGPTVSIAINLSTYPALVRVPGYPVYYASRLDSNYFFYDGMYWVYLADNWYASSWYNGPWYLVAPEAVPLYVLRIPVRYYRQPPPYFLGWQSHAPPRWGEHWGNDWSQRHSGWDRWNRNAAPAPAPLPVYQRQYAGERYPRVEQQQTLHSQNYRYQPRDPIASRQPETQRGPSASPPPAQRAGQGVSPDRRPAPPESQRTSPTPAPAPVVAPRVAPPQEGRKNVERPAATQVLPRKERPPAEQDAEPAKAEAQHRQPEPQIKETPPRPEQGQGQGQIQGSGKDRERADDRGQDNRR